MEMKKSTRYGMRDTRYENGSALILAVVLTSLLAIVGVMFVMVARVDRIATSAISENKTLDSAVEAVIARISQELVLDVPGVSTGNRDYHDYPGPEDKWLASLEPYEKTAGNYYWRQISDVTGYIEKVIPDVKESWDAQDIEIDSDAIIEDHRKIELDDDGNIEGPEGQLADADGDGVADSKWIELEGINSSKGKPIYAAIRIIDNGGMLNVNTAYQFNPASPGTDGEYIDGSEQMQINLMALSWRPGTTSYNPSDETDLLEARANNGSGGLDPLDLDEYEKNVVWRYNEPNGPYTPFDISDDLELRNRFLLNHTDIDTRLEAWGGEFRNDTLSTPVTSGGQELDKWFKRAYDDGSLDPNYAYRHIGTTYNMDRIVNPVGVVFNNGKMVNVNRDGAGLIYNAIGAALFTADPNFKDIDDIAAQTAVNLVAFHDGAGDPNVPTAIVGGKTYYGFTRPCVYISELAHRFTEPNIPPGIPVPASLINRSYAIELHKPYTEDDYPDVNQWQLRIEGYGTFPVDWSGTRHFHVMLFEHPGAPLDVEFDLTDGDPNLGPPSAETRAIQPGTIVFAPPKTISLERLVDEVRDIWITVDSVTVQYGPPGLWDTDGYVHSYQRDITLHKCIRRLWDNLFTKEFSDTLGSNNVYKKIDSVYIQAHPAYRDFTNVGEIGMVFRKSAYYIDPADRPDTIGYSTNTDDEAEVRLNLADPNYHNIFQYLTVWPPSGYALDPNEVRIKGRININTAPWYVIAQLPWMTDKIAQAIVAYRDKLKTPVDYSDPNTGNTGREDATDIDGIRETAGFASIGELATVINNSDEDEYSMHYYALDSNDLEDFPDLTPSDKAEDDFEERDVIFARLSNLVTVRSDVFTAYILVRIGADGPQKRVMAILDRSNVYPPEGGKVRIVALHPVADPR